MFFAKLQKIILPTLILAGISAMIFWFVHDPVSGFSMSIPGMDNRPLKDASTAEVVNIGEKFTFYNEFDSELKGKWPRFRGSDFDNINKENIPLIDNWKNQEPEVLWEAEMGEGHAAPVIYDGRVYILDYDETKKADALKCFALETGQPLWKRWYNVHVKRNHGMSRTVPAVNEKYVVTIGPQGQVMCTYRTSGDFIWGLDMVREYGSEIPFWYTGQCPLIDNNVAILAPGGSSILIGVDCDTGEVIWETPNPGTWQMSHSSIMPMEFSGTRMYVYAAVGGICGVSAEPENRGKLLWKTTAFAPSVVAPSPLVFDDGKIFMTAGYGAGGAMFQLVKNGNNFDIELLYKYKPKDGLASEQQTPVIINGLIYGVLPKDAGSVRNRFVCTSPKDVQQYLWTSDKSERFGLGPYIYADGKFYIVDDDGTLLIAKADRNGFQVLDKRRIIEGQDAWGPIAIADGYLLMRDSKKMVCLNMKK
jgi:outer membrane protein assembly factor BamB